MVETIYTLEENEIDKFKQIQNKYKDILSQVEVVFGVYLSEGKYVKDYPKNTLYIKEHCDCYYNKALTEEICIGLSNFFSECANLFKEKANDKIVTNGKKGVDK